MIPAIPVTWPIDHGGRRRALVAACLLALATGILAAGPVARPTPVDASAGCRIYVAAGDDVPAGNDLEDTDARYPEQLLEDHLIAPGWCLFNQGQEGQKSSTFISQGGMAAMYNKRPDLLTIQLGEQNTPMVDAITKCFDKIKDHDFSGGNACAAAILANTSLWTDMRNNFTTILQTTRIMAGQRPGLVIGVVNYANPFPQATSVVAKFTELCQKVEDATISCMARWAQLPPALVTLDKVFQKLNTTLKESMAPFHQGPNGWRWVYVDIYPKFKGHEMKMEVTLKLDQVCHLCGTKGQYIDNHEGTKNMGPDEHWWVEGSDGTKLPEYLFIPGPLINPPVVILQVSQKTVGMGVYPNADGHQCIADAIWEADTIDPGTTPLKWKLGYGEPSDDSICD